MGTRYSSGDLVLLRRTGNAYTVERVRNPDSDSPDYIIRGRGRSRKIRTVKASDIRKP